MPCVDRLRSEGAQMTAVMLLLPTILATSAAADTHAQPMRDEIYECHEPRHYWYCLYDREGYLAVSWLLDDDHLAGATFGYGSRGYFMEGLRFKTLSGSYQSHQGEEVWGVRRDWSIYPYARWWGGLGPLLTYGLEYRTGDLHPGFGGYIGLGGQLRLWTRDHWHFAINVEHDFGVSSESRNTVEAVIGFGHPKLGSRPFQK